MSAGTRTSHFHWWFQFHIRPSGGPHKGTLLFSVVSNCFNCRVIKCLSLKLKISSSNFFFFFFNEISWSDVWREHGLWCPLQHMLCSVWAVRFSHTCNWIFFSMSQHEIGEKKACNSKLVLVISRDLQLLAVQTFILLSPAGERKQSREDSGWKTTQCASRQERFYLLKHRLS